MTTHNLQKYKESLVVLPHLEMIIKILSLTEKSLSYYKSYTPVCRILVTIKEQKYILESYRESYKRVKESKGKNK